MTRHAKLTTCPRCHQPILTSDWHHGQNVHAEDMKADPTAITPTTETACILIGRPTYNHYHHANQHQLSTRDPTWHKWHPAGQPKHILPAHQCGTTLPGTPLTTTPTPNQPPTDCPF